METELNSGPVLIPPISTSIHVLTTSCLRPSAFLRIPPYLLLPAAQTRNYLRNNLTFSDAGEFIQYYEVVVYVLDYFWVPGHLITFQSLFLHVQQISMIYTVDLYHLYLYHLYVYN